jgi:hypothetical protein
LIDVADGKERKTQDYRNYMTKQQGRFAFALDVHHMGAREFVVITEKGLAYIKGDTTLARLVWRHFKWHDKKAISEKIDETMNIRLSSRMSDREVGAISWSMLVDLVASENGRKAAQPTVKPVTVNGSPIAALQLVQAVAKRDNIETHFSNVESRMIALETAEDVAAFALEGDDMDTLRREFGVVVEKVREILQSKINAKVKLQNVA